MATVHHQTVTPEHPISFEDIFLQQTICQTQNKDVQENEWTEAELCWFLK